MVGGWSALACATGLMLAAPATAGLEAGAGRMAIGLTPLMLPLDGFTTIHDVLQARVLLFRDGARRVALAEVDETSLMSETVAELQAAVTRETGARASDVLVVASHTFSAPHLFGAGHMPPGITMTADEEARAATYGRAVVAATTQAAATAAKGLRPARLRFGEGVADVNVNRNMPMADGYWLGANDSGYSDKRLGILRIDDMDGRAIGFLASYPVQSAIMDHSVGADGGKGITPDLLGAAAGHLEGRYGAAVALLAPGAAGDQMPGYTARANRYDKDGHYRTVDLGNAGYALIGPQGGRLGEAAVRTAESATPVDNAGDLRVLSGSVPLEAQDRPTSLGQIKPSRSYRFIASGKTNATYTLLRIGDVAFVGVQAELSAATGVYIRQHSPFPHTLVATMVNGAAKYMPDAESYKNITYEAMNSSFAPGSAGIFANRILAALKTLRGAR